MTEAARMWPHSGRREQSAEEAASNTTTGGAPGAGIAPVCIGVVSGPLRAEIARSFLEDAGLTVFLSGEAVAGVYGVVSGPLGMVRVLVPAAQAEEGARLFAELDLGTP